MLAYTARSLLVSHREENIFEMESPFILPIRIYYRPPGSLFVFLSLIHVVSLFYLLLPEFPPWSRELSALTIFCSYICYVRDFIHTRRKRVELILRPDNEWRLVDFNRRDDDSCKMTLIPGAFVHPLLVVLKLRSPFGHYTFLLTRENMDADTLRRLRVRLLYPA